MTPEREQEIREDDKRYTIVGYVTSDRRELLAELDSLRQEHERLKEENAALLKSKQFYDDLQSALGKDYTIGELLKFDKVKAERDSLQRQVKIAVEALKDEIQREAVHGNQAPHVTARHARLSRVMAEIEAAKGGSGER